MDERGSARLRSSRRRTRTFLELCAIGLLLFSAATARYLIWPDLQHPPGKVDAIIELGGPGDRDSAALALARAQQASYLVQSTVPVEAGTDRCLPPVRDVSVLCFHADPPTTRGEAWSIARLAQQYGWRSIILVTTPDQALRAHLRVSRCFSGDVYVSTTPLPRSNWLYWIPYQWAASVKAYVFEPSC